MRIRLAVALLTASFVLCVTRSGAQVEALPAAPAGQAIADVRVIIDISGSMKRNDPQNLRRPALELLVQLFPEGSKAGVWTFGQWVNMLVSHKPVTPAWRKGALSKAQKINSVALHTNIPEVLLKATDDIDHLKPGYKTSLILLTDGMVDVSKSPEENAKARQRIIDDILPRLRGAGITVHTVALSNNADKALMERLAVDTNGLAAVAETAEDLTPIFLQAFDAAVPAEQVPLEGNRFLVDSSIEEFTALVFRKAGSKEAVLVSPDGKKYSASGKNPDVKWFSQKNYDLITVKRPYEGQWLIQADLEPNSRVTIVSNLSMQVTPLAKNLFVGGDAKISALLKEQGKTIVNPKLLQLVEMSVDVKRRDDDRQWTLPLSEPDAAPDDGVFTTDLSVLKEAGLYDITVRADGKTFQRQYRQVVEVRDSFSVSSTSTDDTPPNHEVTLFAVNPDIDLNSIAVAATVTHPNGRSEQQAAQADAKQRTWTLTVNGDNQSGMISVDFDVSGSYRNAGAFSQRISADIEHRVIGSTFIAQPEPEPEPTPDPEPEPAKPEPKAQPKPEPEPEPESEDGMDIKTIAMYVGVGIGNLLVFVLGYYVYRLVTSKSGSGVLEQDDEEDDEDDLDDLKEESVTGEAAPAAVPEPEPEPPSDEEMPSDEEVQEPDTELLDSEPEEENEIEEIDIEMDDAELREGSDNGESKLEEELGDMLDLPDDAIDIDPGADEETK